MNSLTLKTLEIKNNFEDSLCRSRDIPNDDIEHEFEAMTSPK